MSKEKNTKQMSLLGDSHVNHSHLQETEKEKMMTDISGMKLLESSENVNPDGLLAKMLKVLLTSKTAWYSDRCKMTWKKKVSKSNVLLFQLQAKVHGIKGKESGFLPTPTAGCEEGGEQSSRVEQTKSGGFVLRKKNNPNVTYGAKLSDAMLYLEKRKMNKKLGGKLSPEFVEFLMGYPMNWTKIEPRE
jgi:hypothetical protein